MELQQEIMSDITVHMKYAKYDAEKMRRESWAEICQRNRDMHLHHVDNLDITDERIMAPFVKGMKKWWGRYMDDTGKIDLDSPAAKALKKKKKGAASPAGAAASPQAPKGMTATPMAAATPLMGGGMVKRKRSIDGIAQRGKTRAK